MNLVKEGTTETWVTFNPEKTQQNNKRNIRFDVKSSTYNCRH